MSKRSLYAYSAARNGRAVVVRRNGVTIAENYHNGGAADSAWPIASGTKSFSGVIAAKLIQDGWIPSYDTRLSDVLEEWRADPVKSQTTLRQMLSQQSGLDPGTLTEAKPYGECMALPMPAADVGKFKYGPASYGVLGAFFNEIVRPNGFANAAHYLNSNVLEPAGVSVRWAPIEGTRQPNLAGGARITAREWADFGEFMRVGSFGELTKPSAGYWAYGMGWWRSIDRMGDLISGKAEVTKPIPGNGYAAIGLGWNMLIVLPERQMTVARLGWTPEQGQPPFVEEEFLALALKL